MGYGSSYSDPSSIGGPGPDSIQELLALSIHIDGLDQVDVFPPKFIGEQRKVVQTTNPIGIYVAGF